ncbi:MAG: PorP/SprF family type IX secretion system membrane protein [Bacteroidota bacterium]
MKYIPFLFLAICLRLSAQDPLFTNTSQSLISLNPSFAGSNGGLRVQSSYRDQWYNLTGFYQTLSTDVDAYIKPMKGGIALSYMRDDQSNGTLVTDRLSLTYAQHLNLLDSKLKIIPSFQITGFQKTLDNSKLSYGDMIDPRRGFVWNSPQNTNGYSVKRNLDFSSGLIINYNHFYFGASMFHITQPQEAIYGVGKLPYRLSLFTSYNLTLSENAMLYAIYRFEKQQSFYNHQININVLLIKHLILGTGIRINNSVNAIVGYRHDYFTLSGCYEFGTGSTMTSSAGTFELSASFNLRNKEDRKLVKDVERW